MRSGGEIGRDFVGDFEAAFKEDDTFYSSMVD